MPTVPSLEQPQVQAEPLPGRPFPRVQDTVSDAAFGTPVAKGFEDLSTVMTSEQARQKIQNDNLRVIDANTQLEAGRNAMLYGQVQDDGTRQGGAFSLHGTDAINLPAKLLPEYQKLADKISGPLTPDQQRLFQAHIAAGHNELNLQLNRYEYEESNRLADEVYKGAVNQAMDSAAIGWKDPIVIGKSRADLKSLIQLQGDREGWPQSSRDMETRALLDQMHYGIVTRMLADGDATAAQSYLNQHLPEMSPKSSESAQRLLYSTQEHQLVMHEKLQKIASDNLSKEGDSLLAQGKLTPIWIEAHRHTLEANEFRYFYKAMSGAEESSTNSQVFADLFIRKANGEDVRDEARKALTEDHTLSRQDFTKLATDETRPGWYKRGAQFIGDTLKVSELEKDPAGQQSRAYALRDWDEWAAANPKATLEQAHKAQDEIANHYRIVPEGKIALMMPAPPHLIGTRANPVDENGQPDPMLNATVRRRNQALRAGEITEEEAQEEAKLIDQYRRIYQAQQAAKAAKGNKP